MATTPTCSSTPATVTPSADLVSDSLQQAVLNIQAQLCGYQTTLASLQNDPTYINCQSSWNQISAKYGNSNTNCWWNPSSGFYCSTVGKGDQTGINENGSCRGTISSTQLQISTLTGEINAIQAPNTGTLAVAIAAVSAYQASSPTAKAAADAITEQANSAAEQANSTTIITIVIVVAVVIIAGIFIYFHFRKKAA